MTDLTHLKINQKAEVIEIIGGYGLKTRLENLGIYKGVKIKKISSRLLGGPVIIQFNNTQVAIGRGMAKKVIVNPVEEK